MTEQLPMPDDPAGDHQLLAQAAERQKLLAERLDVVLARLERIEAALDLLVRQRRFKEWYSTSEVAQLLDKAEFTVREWCRQGRIHAEKKGSGRGKHPAWVISHVELQRIQKEGLLLAKIGRAHV